MCVFVCVVDVGLGSPPFPGFVPRALRALEKRPLWGRGGRLGHTDWLGHSACCRSRRLEWDTSSVSQSLKTPPKHVHHCSNPAYVPVESA